MSDDYAKQAIENAMNEIKRHLKYLYQKAGIHEPPYRVGFKDKNGVFYIDFIPNKRVRNDAMQHKTQTR